MDLFPNPQPFTVYHRGNNSQRMASKRGGRSRSNAPDFQASSLFNPNIIRGPPSILSRARERERLPSSPGRLSPYDVDLVRRARRDAQRPAPVRPAPYRSPGATRVRKRGELEGDCITRAEPLAHKDLWVGGVGPAQPRAKRPHHQCSICLLTKSHPVSYLCGHSHCYVCSRLWLERDFKCPDCATMMYRAPFRHYGEEDFLAELYPDWKDESKVEYKWDGLTFPKFRKVIVVPDSP